MIAISVPGFIKGYESTVRSQSFSILYVWFKRVLSALSYLPIRLVTASFFFVSYLISFLLSSFFKLNLKVSAITLCMTLSSLILYFWYILLGFSKSLSASPVSNSSSYYVTSCTVISSPNLSGLGMHWWNSALTYGFLFHKSFLKSWISSSTWSLFFLVIFKFLLLLVSVYSVSSTD